MNSPVARPLCRLSSIVVIAIGVAGCATWSDRGERDASRVDVSNGSAKRQGGKSWLSRPDSSSAVSIDAEFFAAPIEVNGTGDPEASQEEFEASVWQWVDETAIGLATRRRYQANGLRVGRVVQVDRFRKAIGRRAGVGADVINEFLREAEIASPLSQGNRTLPMRYGRRYEIPLHQPRPGTQVCLLREDRDLVGRTLSNAQLLLGLAVGQGAEAGEIELSVRPEIRHGDARQSFVSSDSAIRIDTRREVWSLETLDLSARLAAGDAIVISTTSPPVGLGRQMLTDDSPGRGREQLFVLLKVKQVPGPSDRL